MGFGAQKHQLHLVIINHILRTTLVSHDQNISISVHFITKFSFLMYINELC